MGARRSGIPSAGVAVGPGRLMCIGGFCYCGRRQMGRCLLVSLRFAPRNWMRKRKHRPFPVGVFQFPHGIPQPRRSRQPPKTVFPVILSGMSRLEGIHTTRHLGRIPARSRIRDPQSVPPCAQGHPEDGAWAACPRSCLNLASPLTVAPDLPNFISSQAPIAV